MPVFILISSRANTFQGSTMAHVRRLPILNKGTSSCFLARFSGISSIVLESIKYPPSSILGRPNLLLKKNTRSSSVISPILTRTFLNRLPERFSSSFACLSCSEVIIPSSTKLSPRDFFPSFAIRISSA